MLRKVVKSANYLSIGTLLKEHLFPKKMFFPQFWTLSETFLIFCQTLFDRVVENAFYVSQESFEVFFLNL